MAGFYRLLAYSVKSMIVANASGALVRWTAAQPPAACCGLRDARWRRRRAPRRCTPQPRVHAVPAPLPPAVAALLDDHKRLLHCAVGGAC